MIEEFNGIIFLGIYILILLGTAYYCFQTIFMTDKFLEKYSMDGSGAFMTRFAGTFILPFVIIMIYMLFKGITGHWIIFAYGFMQSITALIVGFWTVEMSNFTTTKGEKMSREGYLAPLFFSIVWTILIYGVADKIYV
jgi:hypothetical protein